MRRILVFLFYIFVFCQIGSAFLISDQGTNVRLFNGTLLDYGNLTISIYESSSGLDQIFSSNIQGAIINGSWNLMINPDIQYGKIYWKDYEINGEDLDFDGLERLQFQSSSGIINNISFFNLSMISSCPAGAAIKIIYSNGSVDCENIVAGIVDLTNYALKNQSEIFNGNLTSTGHGFFGFLGSIANRINNLFVKDIDASGNISADYFLGDGSLLTNLPSNANETDPIFIAENSTLWFELNSKLSTLDQRYNDTTIILGINNTGNIQALGFYNSSQIDSLISGISNGNVSFNQSLTDVLYYSANNPLNFINSTLVSIYNDSLLVLSVNSTLWAYLSSNQNIWVSSYNSTYNSLLNQQCPVGMFVNGTLSNGTLSCVNFQASSYSIPEIKTQRSDLSTSSGTIWSNSNLNFNYLGSKNYTLSCEILYTGSAATTGQAVNLSVSGSTTSDVTVVYDTWSSATASIGFSTNSFGTGLIGTGSGATVIRPNRLIADFRTTGSGTLNLSIRSEVDTSTTTLKRGSRCTLFDVTDSS